MASLDFRFFIGNQNGRHLETKFFFQLIFFHNSFETWYVYVFMVCESISIVRFHVRPQMRLRRPFWFYQF